MVADDFIKAKLVEVAWKRAGHISFPACAAVMFCVRNLLEKNGDQNWLRALGEVTDPRDPEFQKLLELVDSVFDGSKPDNITNGATSWQEGSGKERAAVIGGLVLFK